MFPKFIQVGYIRAVMYTEEGGGRDLYSGAVNWVTNSGAYIPGAAGWAF